MSPKPVLDSRYKPIANSPPEPKARAPKKWKFSFRYWKEIEFFGFNRTESRWFVSLLERLASLSNEDVEKFLCNPQKRSALRYHQIDWGHKNIPIEPKDLYWLPKDIQENEEELFLVQFQISTALGRVIGFWDREYVFNIVLLDPFHNMQPSKYYKYKVDPCSPLRCDYTKLINSIEFILDYHCKKKECDIVTKIKAIPTSEESLLQSNVIVVKVTDEDIAFAKLLMDEGKITSLSQLILDGLKYHINT